jgi:hypothetical protein
MPTLNNALSLTILQLINSEFKWPLWAVISVPGVNEDKHAEAISASVTIS